MKELTKEEQIDLIAGRIIDEYRKHSGLIDDWYKIAAAKIQSQWSEYYSDQNTKPLMDKITTLEAKLKAAESVNEGLCKELDNLNHLMPIDVHTSDEFNRIKQLTPSNQTK